MLKKSVYILIALLIFSTCFAGGLMDRYRTIIAARNGGAPAVTLTPSPTSWSPTCNENDANATQTFTLTANNGAVNCDSPAASLTTGTDFFIDTDNCDGATVSEDGNCTIDVHMPCDAAGTPTDTLTVASDASDSPKNISLSGTISAPDECAGLVRCQNFEGTGYDNSETWSASGTVDPDYTTTTLRGSQSLLLTGTSYIQNVLPSTYSEIHAHVMFRTDSIAAESIVITFRDASTTMMTVRVQSSGLIRFYHGTVVSGSGSFSVSADTTYHLWVDYIASTGADDGVGSVYIAASTTKPGTPDITISNGNSVGAVARVQLNSSTGINKILDQALVSTSAIGDVAN